MKKNQLNILIVDDEKIICDGLSEFLSQQSYNVYIELTSAGALQFLKKNKMDIILLDIKLPGISGLEVLKIVKHEYPDIEVIMITGHGDMESIIEAMNLGAFDYFYKPISLIEIGNSIKRTDKFIMLNNEIRKIKSAYSLLTAEYKNNVGGEIIGKSKKINNVLNLVKKAAKSNSTSVLITGNSGCGKELIARSIHYLSDRKDNYFYPINCSAIPESLIESEFFGHLKGSFTGANEDKKGYFEAANNGTLFIDEIGDMPYSAQSKILRVLESKSIKRIGSNHEIKLDVRIISATNKNIKKMVEENKFRLDLYYRLNTLEINIPPLKERREDIVPLLEYYLKYYSIHLNRKLNNVDNDVYELLLNYDFPGNARELKNMVERAIILCEDGHIKLNHFPYNMIISNGNNNENLNLDLVEKEYILKALDKANHNISGAADLLNISRSSLYRKMKKYNIF